MQKGLYYPEQNEKLIFIRTIFPVSEISKFLGCSFEAVQLWLRGKRTPRKIYHNRIDVLYNTAMDIYKKEPKEVILKTTKGKQIKVKI